MAYSQTPSSRGLSASSSWSSASSYTSHPVPNSNRETSAHVPNSHDGYTSHVYRTPSTPSRLPLHDQPYPGSYTPYFEHAHTTPAMQYAGSENVPPIPPTMTSSSLGTRVGPVSFEGPAPKRHCPGKGSVAKMTDQEVIEKGCTDEEIIGASLALVQTRTRLPSYC